MIKKSCHLIGQAHFGDIIYYVILCANEFFLSHSTPQVIQRNFWKVSRNLGIAAKGWSHPTKGMTFLFTISLVTISM